MLLEQLETDAREAPKRPHKKVKGEPQDNAWPMVDNRRYQEAYPSKDITLTGQKFQWVLRAHRLYTEKYPCTGAPLLALIPLYVRRELPTGEASAIVSHYRDIDPNSKSTHTDRVKATQRFWESPFPLTALGWVKEGNVDGLYHAYIKEHFPLEVFDETVISEAFIKRLSEMLPFKTQHSDYDIVEQVYRYLRESAESLDSNGMLWSNEGLWFKHLQAAIMLSLGTVDIAKLPLNKVCYDLGAHDDVMLGPVLSLPSTGKHKYLKVYNWPAVYLDVRPLLDYILPYIGLALCQTRLAGMSQWSVLKKRVYQKHAAELQARIQYAPGQLTLASESFDKEGALSLSSDRTGGLQVLPEKKRSQ